MTDYTPTTEDIKYAYAHWKGQEPEFDRWLAEVKADVYDEALQDAEVSPLPRNPYRRGKHQ